MKLIKKILITSPYNVLEFESWLSDLALKGLYLHHIGHFFAYFYYDKPSRIEYRIDIDKLSNLSEKTDLYFLYNWNYITTKGDISIYNCLSEQFKQEIHTSSMVQSYSLKKIKRKKDFSFIIMVIFIISTILLNFNLLFYNKTPILNLVNEGTQYIYIFFVNFLLLLIIIKDYIDIFKIYNLLLKNNEINHHISWKKSNNFIKILLFFTTISILICSINIFFTIKNIQYSYIVNQNTLKVSEYTPKNLNMILKIKNSNEFNYEYKIKKRSNIFVKSIVYVNESISSNTESALLKITRYQLYSKFLINRIINDLITSDLYDKNILNYNKGKVEIKGLENVNYIESDRNIIFYFSKNDTVIHLEFIGDTNIENIINLLTNFE